MSLKILFKTYYTNTWSAFKSDLFKECSTCKKNCTPSVQKHETN